MYNKENAVLYPKLGFIVHYVGRGILDAPVNLHGKLTLPAAIIALISFGNWKNETFFQVASGMPRPTNGGNRNDKRKFKVRLLLTGDSFR